MQDVFVWVIYNTVYVVLVIIYSLLYRKRALLDSDAKENQCQQESIARKKRIGQSSTLLEALHAFTSAIKEGPDYIGVCCNRLMYRKTILQFQVSNYDKAPSEFVVPKTVSAQDKQWICKTCHSTLKQGRLPAQAKANNLDLDDIPAELSELNPLETRLISLRIPFMKMVALPCGKQRAIHGPAVNVSTDLTPVCTLLPRLPSQTQMVPMKLKRKLCYKGHYMYQYIRPAKVLAALQLLKLNNPLYKDIEINSDWLSDAAQDNAELWEALSAEQCPPPSSSTVTTTTSLSQSMNGEYNCTYLTIILCRSPIGQHACIHCIIPALLHYFIVHKHNYDYIYVAVPGRNRRLFRT